MYQLRKGYETDVTVAYVDDAGEEAQVEGDPQWSVSDDTVLTIVPGANPFAIVLQATGMVGAQARLEVQADADLGAGVEPVLAGEDVFIVSGQATSASFAFGEQRPIAAPE